MQLNDLTPEESKIIRNKGTEPPFSGKYENHFDVGVYVCRQCGAYLYRSENKFDAHCGWPSFDDEINGAVKRNTDVDGIRTEIICIRCDAHLGHVFVGESLTQKNIRHCVNSISMDFIKDEDVINRQEIILGGGCFWCIEAVLKILSGVIGVQSGYAGGNKENPKYEDVSLGDTGHAEVVKIEFDPTLISLEKILEVFFESHDPTTLNRQGSDVGTQYRSVIYCIDEAQMEIVLSFVQKIQNNYSEKIVTEIEILNRFWIAEKYHQDYFKNNPENTYCQIVIAPKIEKIQKKFLN